MKSYRHSNGHRVFRSGSGRFRKTTFEDVGIYDGNKECTVFICNVCEREFVPLVLSGTCCGVDDKRVKQPVYTSEQQDIVDKINTLKQSRFINRQILSEIEDLQRQLKANPPLKEGE